MKTLGLMLIAAQIVSSQTTDPSEPLRVALAASAVKGASIYWITPQGNHALHYGHADSQATLSVGETTRFRAGSFSKLATALITLRAEEAGLLSLDDPLEKWLPNILDGSREWTEKVTLAHLLEHTAGLPGSSYAEYAANTPDLSPTDYLKQNSPFKLRWDPGIHYSYANSGATIIGAVLEKAYGRSFDQIATKELFAPLGMSSSDFSNTSKNLSACFDAEGKEIPALWKMPVRPAGSLTTTTADLGKLMRMLLARGKLPNGTHFLAEKSITRMETAATSIAAKHGATAGAYGLGNFGFVENSTLFRGHWGRTDGFQTNFGYLPGSASGFILMVNTADRSTTHSLRKILASHLATAAPPPKPTPIPKPFPSQSGTYVNFSHDMPLRTWLFALLEAKKIEATARGLTIRSLYGGPPQQWTEVSQNLYQADGIPVATGTFHTTHSDHFWVDGESFIRRHPALIFGEIITFALATAAALAAIPLTLAMFFSQKNSTPRIPLAALIIAAGAFLTIPFLFYTCGLAGMGDTIGRPTIVSFTQIRDRGSEKTEIAREIAK